MQTHTFSKKTIAVAIVAGTAFTGVVAPAQHLPTATAAGVEKLEPVDGNTVDATFELLDEDGVDYYKKYGTRSWLSFKPGHTGTDKLKYGDLKGGKNLTVVVNLSIGEDLGTGSFRINLPFTQAGIGKSIVDIKDSDERKIGTMEVDGSTASVTIDQYPGTARKATLKIPIVVSDDDLQETYFSQESFERKYPGEVCKTGIRTASDIPAFETTIRTSIREIRAGVNTYKYVSCYKPSPRKVKLIQKVDDVPDYRGIKGEYEAPSLDSPTVGITKFPFSFGMSEKPEERNKTDRGILVVTFDKDAEVNLPTGDFTVRPKQSGTYTDKFYNPSKNKFFDTLEDAQRELDGGAYVFHYRPFTGDKTYPAHGSLKKDGDTTTYTLKVDIPGGDWASFDLTDYGTVKWLTRPTTESAKVTSKMTAYLMAGRYDGTITVPLTPSNASGVVEFKHSFKVDAKVDGNSADSREKAVTVAKGTNPVFKVAVTNTGNIGMKGVRVTYPEGVKDASGKTFRDFPDTVVERGATVELDLGSLSVDSGIQPNTFTVTSNVFGTQTDNAWTNVDSRTMAEIAASAGGSFMYPVGHVVFDDPVNKSHDGVIAPVNLDAKNVKSIDIDKSGVPDFVQVGVDKDGKEGTNGNIIFLVSPQKPDLTNMHNIVYIPVTATYKDGSVANTTATILLGEYERYVTNVEKNDAGDYVVTSNWGEQWTISLSDIRKLIADNKAAIDVLKKDNDTNKAAIEQLKRDTKANADKIKDLEGRVKKNEDAIQALQDKDEEHDKALKDLDERVKNHENRISDLEGKVSKLRTDVNQNTKDIAELKGKVSKVEKELETERNERIAADNVLQGQIDTLVKDVTKAKETLSDHEKRITDLEKRVAKNEDDITSIKKQIGDINAEISSIKTDINNKYNTLNTMVENLDKRVTNNTEEINNLKTRMTKVEGDIIDINNRIDGINIKIGDLENKLNKEIQDRKDGDNKLSLRIDGVDKRVTDIDARVTNLTNVVNEGNNVNKEEITKIKNEISSIKNDITNLRNDVNKNTANITNLDKRVTEIEGRVTNVENRVTNLEGRVGVLESTNKKWAQCYSGIGIAALPALLSIPLWGLGNAQIPAIQQFNTDVQKQIGMFNPELAAFVENTGAVQIIATILGVASAIGLVAYAANECRPYNETDDAKGTPLGSMSSDMYQAFDPDGKGSSDADTDADAK